MKPIGPDDKLCPSCNAIILIERKPTRPDEEKGWTLRHFASIAGQAGCAVMVAQNAVVLIGVAAFAARGVEFLQQPNVTPDLGPVSVLGLFASALDLIGLTLVAAALIALGAGAMLLRRRDPFTEEEVAVPTRTAAFPAAAGLLVIVWVLLTATWRVVFPADIGRSAAQLLADFAAGGTPVMPASMPLMMGLWVIATIALFAAALLLGFFGRRLPSKIFAPRSVKTVAWTDFALLNLILTIGIAVFPSGLVAYRGLEIVYLSLLATKLTVLALFGVLSYWTLLSRFDAFGRLSLMVPVMKAIPQEVSTVTAVVEAEAAKTAPPEPTVFLPPPTEDDMRGIEHVK
ncbi:MAG: hypothetical protein A3K65_06640 [Euryarchaeota archaeon RBG_16_68_12]|nr:MAG: hypothetical protein A3K65_06640 [Euryarchaeota archaeon RBG_16_68_12]